MSAPIAAYKRPESVLVVVISATNAVLVLQRADRPTYWQSITGSLEHQESPEHAAWRELREETGLDHQAGVLLDCQTYNFYEIYPHWRARYAPGVTVNKEHVFVFQVPAVCRIQLSPSEHLSYQWLSVAAARRRMFSQTNRQVLARLAEYTGDM